MRYLEFWAVMVFVALIGAIGAWMSKGMKDGGPIWVYMLTVGLLTTGSWVMTVKRSPYNLLVSTVLWDIAYNASWLAVTIFVLKEQSSPWQATGAVLVATGLMLMGL